jgi:DNA-binding GntR family transcriptional regulator
MLPPDLRPVIAQRHAAGETLRARALAREYRVSREAIRRATAARQALACTS